jgi:hypothetical protein
MKKILLFIVIGAAMQAVIGQDITKVAKAKDEAGAGTPADTVKHWYINGTGGLTVSQASFTNWSAGGENSVGLDAILNFQANYKKGNHAWGNSVALGYGFQILGAGDNAEFRKTNDKIELTTAYGYAVTKNKHWYATALVNFRTQFADGFNYPDDSTLISTFMAPGYLIGGVGITYNPMKGIALYLSPISARYTFVLNDTLSAQGAFGVDSLKKVKSEYGPYFRADINRDLAKNINLSTTLELYTNYLKDFGNIDVNWSVMVTMKVNKWLAATVSTQLIYDNDITIGKTETSPGGPRTQFKEMIGVGISYIFNNQKPAAPAGN